MGAGASTPRGPIDPAEAKNQNKLEPSNEVFMASPFDDETMGSADLQGVAGSKNLSPARLKKLAMGLPTYKEVERDYNSTLDEIEFNKAQIADWIAPPQGFGDKKPERLVDDYPYGKTSSSAQKYPQQDVRAAVGRGGGAAASGRSPAPIGPGGRPRPPPPRRPSNPSPITVPSPISTPAIIGGGHTQLAASQMIIEAPSVLPRPKAALDAPPAMLSTSGIKHFQPVSVSGAAGALSTPGNWNPSAAIKAGANAAASVDDRPSMTPPSSSTGRRHPSARPLDAASPARPPTTTPSSPLPDAPKEPPPHIPVRPFPSQEEQDDNMYATFLGPRDMSPAPSARPSNVPALVMGTSSPSKSTANSNSASISAASALTPQGKPPSGAKPAPPRPSLTPGISGSLTTPTSRSATFTVPAGSPKQGRPPTLNVGQAQGERTGIVRAVDPTTGAVTKSTANAPPKPTTKNVHEVKETTDVKRNRAQLPSLLTHAKPTTGDWLKKRYIVNNYILLDILGAGSYGEVRMCKDRTTDHLYAIKIISKDLLKKKKNGNTSETYFEDIKREIAIMKKLLHPNVLRLFEVLDDPNVNKMYLVLEYMKKGDLINILKTREVPRQEKDAGDAAKAKTPADLAKSVFTPLSDIELWNIFRQVAAGIRYLHYQNIVHGDIKPQNLLVGEDGVVKIADFGIAKMLHGSGAKLIDAAGTPAFMAPELFDSGKAFSGQLSDIWAMGATMFMLRFGHPPFVAKNIVKLSDKIMNDPLVFPSVIDDYLRDLLENMLRKDPIKRLTLQQVIMHRWFRVTPAAERPVGSALGKERALAQSSTIPGPVASQSANLSGGIASFMPPASYANEEALAMGKKVTADDDDIFMSIGTRATPMKRVVSQEEDEEEEEGDVMATQWGADVFEMVDDEGDESDDSDEDGGSTVKMDSTRDVRGGKPEKADHATSAASDVGTSRANSYLSDSSGTGAPTALERTGHSLDTTQHTEMSVEEGERRAKRFQETSKRRSLGHMDREDAETKSFGMGTTGGDYEPPLFRTGLNRDAMESKDSKDELQSGRNAPGVSAGQSAPNPTGRKLLTVAIPDHSDVKPAPAPPIMTPGDTRSSGIGAKNIPRSPGGQDDDEETEQLTMEEFNGLMDTLARQPHRDDDDQEKVPVNISLKPSTFSAQLRNYHNFVGASFYSEQGQRDKQEDRCVLIPDVSKMKAFTEGEAKLSVDHLDELKRFSIAGVFDGHSGWRCAQLLAQNLIPNLVLHSKFLGKQPDAAILDTFKMMDEDICRQLRQAQDSSGSTAVIAIYDGRKHVLTVANVGDSMCVLSRGGRAVKLHRMHRLGADDAAERTRVEQAGGAVINNR